MAEKQLVKGIGIGLVAAAAVAALYYAASGGMGFAALSAGPTWIDLDLTAEAWQKVQQNPQYCPQDGDIAVDPAHARISKSGTGGRPRMARWLSTAGSRYTWTVRKKGGSRDHLKKMGATYTDTFQAKSAPTDVPPDRAGARSLGPWPWQVDYWEWEYDVVLATDGCVDQVVLDPDIYIDK